MKTFEITIPSGGTLFYCKADSEDDIEKMMEETHPHMLRYNKMTQEQHEDSLVNHQFRNSYSVYELGETTINIKINQYKSSINIMKEAIAKYQTYLEQLLS